MNIKFLIRKTKSKDKVKESPIYIRMWDSSRGIDIWQKSNLSILADKWDPKAEAIKARIVMNEEERSAFDDQINELRKYIRKRYEEENFRITIDSSWLSSVIADYWKPTDKDKRQPKKSDFKELYARFIKTHKVSVGRAKHYAVMRDAILRYENYIKSSVRKSYSFDVRNVNTATLENIWDYLVNEHELAQKQPELYEGLKRSSPRERGTNTMIGLFKILKTFFVWCNEQGIINTSPFDGFKFPNEKYGSPLFINKDELHQLLECDLSDKKSLEIQRDIFVFQCCVGCRVGDMMRLKKMDVINGELQYIPHKTINEKQQTIRVPLNVTAKAILEKYPGDPEDRLFPFITPQKYNEEIKEALKKAGINRLITRLNPVTGDEEKVPIFKVASSHMARRTFVGNLYNRVQDPKIISSMTGHSENSRSFSRYREINDDIKTNLVNLLD